MIKLKPQKLQKGDTIAIISPSGYVSYPEKFESATKYFEEKGCKVKIYPHAKKQYNYLAGKDSERIEDIENAFKDKEVKAILTSRGGYGAARISDKIDYKIIKNNPKIFCGYSDISAFHSAIFNKTGLVTFHGPFALFDFGATVVDKYTEKNFWNILTQNYTNQKLSNVFNYTCIKEGQVKGELVGGNLCILTSLLGTEFAPDFENKILFLEDVNEPLYKIDRMLQQLRLNGVFEKIKGILVGKFSSDEKDFEKKVFELLNEIQLPCGYGFSASHELQKTTLPLNVEYTANFKTGEIQITEDYLVK